MIESYIRTSNRVPEVTDRRPKRPLLKKILLNASIISVSNHPSKDSKAVDNPVITVESITPRIRSSVTWFTQPVQNFGPNLLLLT